MKTATNGFGRILEQKRAELAQTLQTRDGIATEKSADQMDEIQNALERDVAIWNVDSNSSLLRAVSSALGRIRDGAFGTCVDCELPINPRRLTALPWASRCIQCQEMADRNGSETKELPGGILGVVGE